MPTSKTHHPTRRRSAKRRATKRWSGRVTRESNALDLDRSVFTWKDPKRIARSLERSAERSHRRKSDPYRSAMSMLTFYINRAGENLSASQRRVLERAKDELRATFGRQGRKPASTRTAPTKRKTTSRSHRGRAASRPRRSQSAARSPKRSR